MPTFIGKTVTVAEDKQLQVGDTLPDFNQTATDLARAVLVADADNKITYVEYLDNINTDPNYEAAVAAVKSL